jgi:hypothetical protein
VMNHGRQSLRPEKVQGGPVICRPRQPSMRMSVPPWDAKENDSTGISAGLDTPRQTAGTTQPPKARSAFGWRTWS